MSVNNITSANAELVLTVAELYPAGIRLENFGTDQSYAIETTQVSETRMGVDGYLSAGIINNVIPVTITLEAGSPSYEALASLLRAMKSDFVPYECTLTIRVPAIRETHTLTGGVLQTGLLLPAGAQTLQPTTWTFHFTKDVMEKF